ncbi:reverse transcriptase domain, reverse transcriptase zinc-binding domain protein [Tanacetum coccineum]
MLNSIAPPISMLGNDKLEWHDMDGVVQPFSVQTVWNTIRPRCDKVSWYHCVWFSSCIPRHALNLWLVIKRRLKTQDLLRPWDNVDVGNLSCSLCDLQEDSHEHLFFECNFSKQVWFMVKRFAGFSNSMPSIDSIIHDIIPFAKRKSSRSIIVKLVVATITYFIWQERNNCMFKKSKRSVEQVANCIINVVRLKLLSCKWKKSKAVCDIIGLWNLEHIDCVYGIKKAFSENKDPRHGNMDRIVLRDIEREEGMISMVMKTAFLNGSLKEEVYVSQPEGFTDMEHLDPV